VLKLRILGILAWKLPAFCFFFLRDDNFGAKLKIRCGRYISKSSQTLSYNTNILVVYLLILWVYSPTMEVSSNTKQTIKNPLPPPKKMFVLGTDDTDSVFKSNKKIGVWQNIYFRLHNEGWQIVKLNVVQSYTESRDSSVGTASRYGLVGPAIESGGDEIFRTCPDRPGGPPILLHNGYRIFPGGKAAGAWC